MPNLKDLKIRISSVKSTQKITQAMKVVAASKLRRARERAEAATPYAIRMNRMITTLAANIEPSAAPALLAGSGREENTCLKVVVSSDRGLCGGLNSGLLKVVREDIKNLEAKGKKVKIICVGKKAKDLLEKDFGANIIGAITSANKKAGFDYDDAEQIASQLIDLFKKEEFEVCHLYYNQFVSALVQKPIKHQLVPVEIKQEASDEDDNRAKSTYLFEPDEAAILDDLLPRNIGIQIFHGMLENMASEQGARMTAMDNATRNAGDMIKSLTLQYNRTRQAVITKELIEIISGAEAL